MIPKYVAILSIWTCTNFCGKSGFENVVNVKILKENYVSLTWL